MHHFKFWVRYLRKKTPAQLTLASVSDDPPTPMLNVDVSCSTCALQKRAFISQLTHAPPPAVFQHWTFGVGGVWRRHALWGGRFFRRYRNRTWTCVITCMLLRSFLMGRAFVLQMGFWRCGWVHLKVSVFLYIHTYTFTYTRTDTYVCTYIHAYIHIYIYIHTHTYIHTCIIYIYIYTHIHGAHTHTHLCSRHARTERDTHTHTHTCLHACTAVTRGLSGIYRNTYKLYKPL